MARADTTTTTATDGDNPAAAAGGTAERGAERTHDPVHRVSYSFRREGPNLWVETWLEPGGHLPEHFHPSLEERWEALDGTVRVKLDGTWRDLAPADGPVTVLPNIRHELKNPSERTVHLRTEVIPAGRLEEFLVESARAAREGLYNARNLPTGWRGATLVADFALRFRDETVMTSPPPALQRVVLPLLARFAR
jgi:quercetin dioxygenase-like cupin family protein